MSVFDKILSMARDILDFLMGEKEDFERAQWLKLAMIIVTNISRWNREPTPPEKRESGRAIMKFVSYSSPEELEAIAAAKRDKVLGPRGINENEIDVIMGVVTSIHCKTNKELRKKGQPGPVVDGPQDDY